MALEICDSDLLSCVLAGETEVFSPLVGKYHKRLLRHIRSRLGDGEVAKDLTQETWKPRAFRGLMSFPAILRSTRGKRSLYDDYIRREIEKPSIVVNIV